MADVKRATPSLLLGLALFFAALPAPAKDTVAKCTEAAEGAQRKRAAGQLRAASQLIPACLAPECPALVRKHCGKWREELAEVTPTLVFRVVDANGHDVSHGKILLDDEAVSETLDGRAVPVDPGAHKVQWVHEKEHIERDIVVREGERARAVVLALPSSTTTAPAAATKPVPPSKEREGASPWPWVLGGIGLGLGVTGAVFWGVGSNEHGNLESSCARTSSCREADVSRAKTELVVGDVLVGVGVVAIATTVVWLILRDTSSPTTSAGRKTPAYSSFPLQMMNPRSSR